MSQHQMTIAELLLNPSVKAEDEIRLNNQAHKILNLLKHGRVSTSDLIQIAYQYNARIFEIRKYLKQFGQMVKMTPQTGGNNIYEIQDLKGN